jgi:hypothetical protein
VRIRAIRLRVLDSHVLSPSKKFSPRLEDLVSLTPNYHLRSITESNFILVTGQYTLMLRSQDSSESPDVVARMTPITVKAGFDSAVPRAGFHIKLARGGNYNANVLRSPKSRLRFPPVLAFECSPHQSAPVWLPTSCLAGTAMRRCPNRRILRCPWYPQL